MTGLHGLTWASLASEWGIPYCDHESRCGLSRVAHLDGRVVDGVLHWHGMASKRATRRGIRHFLKLVSLIENPASLKEPLYVRLYLQNVWAWREAQRRFHVRLRTRDAEKDMEYILDLTMRRQRGRPIHLSRTNPNIYRWIMNWRYR